MDWERFVKKLMLREKSRESFFVGHARTFWSFLPVCLIFCRYAALPSTFLVAIRYFLESLFWMPSFLLSFLSY